MIPIIIPYEDDEFIHSWICRLSTVNGFINVQDFASIYVNPYAKLNYNYINIHFLEKNLSTFDKVDILQLVCETSLYPFLAIFMSRKKQLQYLSNMLSDPSNSFYKDIAKSSSKISQIKICPCCRKEEEEKKGFYYVHRSHQLPGVKVCHKHKCKLEILQNVKNNNYKTTIETKELKLAADLDAEYSYAKFVHDLLYANLDLNREELNNILVDEMKKRNITSIKNLLLNIHRDSKLAPILNSRKYINKKQRFILNIEEICVIFFEFFQSVQNIPITLVDKTQLIEQIHKENYSIDSVFNRNILKIKHNVCNTNFITTFSGIVDGWGCPNCENKNSNTTRFKKIVYKSSNNEYNVVSNFEGWAKEITINHRACNTIYSISPQNFYFNERRCKCEHKLSIKEVKKRIEKYEGFKLIKYTRHSDHVKIYSEKCGHEFNAILSAFVESPYCRKCRPYKMTLNEFSEEVKSLTGNEYKVIGDYYYLKNSKKIKLYHTNCDNVFPISRSMFLKGKRCPYCSKKITYKELCNFVSEKTNGIYKCTSNSTKPKGPITLINTITNETLNLDKYLILQEINRPTPSVILKYNKQNNIPYLDKKMQYLEHIKDKYDISDLFFPQDFEKQDKKRAMFAYLSKHKKIQHISVGVYSINLDSFSPEEISYRFYEKKNNQIIGYRIGYDFLKQIGHFSGKKEKLTITTKRCPYASRTQTYRGAKTTIYQCYYPILDNKALIVLPVIDTLRLLKCDETILRCLASYLKKNNISLIELEEYLSYYSESCRKIVKSKLKEGNFI